jgi:hypothetical protein
LRYQEILEACWTGYQQQGMKKKGDRQVPNCVPVEEVKAGPEIAGKDLLFKAAAMAMLAASQEGVTLDYEQAIKQASRIYGIPYQPSELPRLLAQRAEIDRQLALLKQGKQVAKARRQEKRAPTPAGAEEYWKTHALPTDRIKPATKSLEEATDIFLDNAARDMMAVLSMMAVGFGYGIYVKIRNKLDRYQGYQIVSALEDKGVTMNRATYEKVKPVLDQFKQALKDNDGAQAKELAKRIEQMIIMGKLSAPEPQAADTALASKEKELAEDLKKWFKEKWVRFGPDGKIRGDCARGSSSEGKPKCLPQSKAQALGKKGRASAAAKKRREDPNPERRGAAKNVATRVNEFASDPERDDDDIPKQILTLANRWWNAGDKQPQITNVLRSLGWSITQVESEDDAVQLMHDDGTTYFVSADDFDPDVFEQVLDEKQDACYRKVKSRYKVWPSAYASGALVQCRKKGAANWGNKDKK